MSKKDKYNHSYHKIIEQINENHTEVERKKFEKTINNRNMNRVVLILVILMVLALIFIFIMIGYQPYPEYSLLEENFNLLSFQTKVLHLINLPQIL